MKKTILIAAALLLGAAAHALPRKSYTLASPDGRLQTTVTAAEATYDIVRDGRTLLEGFAPRHDTRQRRRVGRRIPRDQSLPHQRRPVDRFALLPGRLDPRKLQRPNPPHEGRLERGVPAPTTTAWPTGS